MSVAILLFLLLCCTKPQYYVLLFILLDYQGQCLQYCFVQYSFDGQEHPIELKPHGNSKQKKPFSRSKPSIFKLLEKKADSQRPLQALREVDNIKGGVMSARSACDLPRDRKQVYNIKAVKKAALFRQQHLVAFLKPMCWHK